MLNMNPQPVSINNNDAKTVNGTDVKEGKATNRVKPTELSEGCWGRAVVSKETYSSLKDTIEKHFAENPLLYHKDQNPVPLHMPFFHAEEALAFLMPVLEREVTMGGRVREAEVEWGAMVGVGAEGVSLCNSGSSALLLALSALSSHHAPDDIRLRPGDEVIVPAVSWSTSVWVVAQNNLVPVFVDSEMEGLNMDPLEIEKAVTDKTRAILLIHTYGNPCDMTKILQIAKKHDLVVIEDCCEAAGAFYGGKGVGSLGTVGVFSFYFSHHITSIEGGAVTTLNPTLHTLINMKRAHGWSRHSDWHQKLCRENPMLDGDFLFADTGYNLRPTEPQAAMLSCQMKRLTESVKMRREIAKKLDSFFHKYPQDFWTQKELPGAYSSWFGYPVVVKEGRGFSGKELKELLGAKGIGTRPIIAGNLTRHPGCQTIEHRISGDMKNADRMLTDGFVIPIHFGRVGGDMSEHIHDSLQHIATQLKL